MTMAVMLMMVVYCVRSVPCTPGTYVPYEYSYHETSSARCTPCELGYYQDQYGMSECTQCPASLSGLAEAATSCPGKHLLTYLLT